MESSANALNWFEISAHDIDRAQHFYQNIFGMEMQRMDMMGMEMAGFPIDPMSGKVGGALVKSAFHTPSENGVVLYLNGNPDLGTILDRVHGFGGQIAMPKTKISDEIGYMGMFIDTEGNRIGLHSNN